MFLSTFNLLPLILLRGRNVALPRLFTFKYWISFFAIVSFSVITFEIAPPRAISTATSYFFYTEKIANLTLDKNELYQSIKEESSKYNEEYINAFIEDGHIVPGLNGKTVNIKNSFYLAACILMHKLYKIQKTRPAVYYGARQKIWLYKMYALLIVI